MALALLFAVRLALADCTDALGPPRFDFTDPRRASLPVRLGAQTAGVTLLVRDDHEAFVAIKYFRSLAQRTNDVAAFALLSRFGRGSNGRFFRLPERLESVPVGSGHYAGALLMSYAPGRTVANLLADESVDDVVRREIEDRYYDAIAWLSRQPIWRTVRARDWEPERPWASGVMATTYGVRWLLKADNVIVDPWSLALTLIDPY